MAITRDQLEARSNLAAWLTGTLSGQTSSPPPDLGRAGIEGLVAADADLLAGVASADRAVEIESERVRLFVNAPGGVPAPPYGSWWLDGVLDGASTQRVVAFYLREGLQNRGRTGPADYLGTELEFLGFLLQHQRAARFTSADDLERQSREREIEFIEAQMDPWVGSFCQAGCEATQDPFWGAFFRLVRRFVEIEALR